VNFFSRYWQPCLAFTALALLAVNPVMAKGNTSSAKDGAGQATTFDGIDFGNDASQWAKDGECDDPRFTGPGSAVELLDEDTGRDATDCLTLYKSGEVSLVPKPADVVNDIDFGDNSSEWANDGECDDPRFAGKGVDDILLDEDMGKDANDCRKLFLSGQIDYLGDDTSMNKITLDGIDFGDNSSEWANDNECDDPRFTGKGMAEVLLDADQGKDANDCLALYQAGSITLSDAGEISGAGAIDFGDDSSEWANDGECDDPRFAGKGMADELLDEDMGKDATDCKTLFENKQIYLAVDNPGKSGGSGTIDFGDDSSEWNNDGECDDPRFVGDGVGVKLLLEDLGADATDCKTLFDKGKISLISATNFDFGDDSSRWANDGECDDPRFEGEGMAAKLEPRDFASDATDCKALFDDGQISFIGGIGIMTSLDAAPDANISGIDFGDDSSEWANDGECDDPRFKGEGMADELVSDDLKRDASDCRALFDAGKISLAPEDNAAGANINSSGIDFGDDSSSWANDGECDDPRFKGEGVDTILAPEDLKRDATDCRTLFEAGKISLI